MVNEHPTQHRNLLECRRERELKCSKILKQIYPIMLKLAKFRSHIAAARGDQLVRWLWPALTSENYFIFVVVVVLYILGHMRPSSPLLDSVRDQFEDYDQLAKDFTRVFLNLEPVCMQNAHLFDVVFLVGQSKQKVTRLIGVRAILGVRSRVFQVSDDARNIHKMNHS